MQTLMPTRATGFPSLKRMSCIDWNPSSSDRSRAVAVATSFENINLSIYTPRKLLPDRNLDKDRCPLRRKHWDGRRHTRKVRCSYVCMSSKPSGTFKAKFGIGLNTKACMSGINILIGVPHSTPNRVRLLYLFR